MTVGSRAVEREMHAAVAALRQADPLLRRLIDGCEPFAFRRTERHPFEALVRSFRADRV